MISITKLQNRAGKGSKSVMDYMRASEYYAGKGIGDARWEGVGAFGLRLNERTPAEQNQDFEALLNGKHPFNGKKLGKGKEKNRVMGFDLTFNSPKAFTLAYVLADDAEKREAILRAHSEARHEALAFLLEQPMLRRGKDGLGGLEKAESPIIRTITHIDNREGEAHLHDHCVLIAKTQAPDGTWLTIDNRAMVLANHAASSIYDRAFAEKMEALGYGIERERHFDGRGNEKPSLTYHIAGISQAVEDATSSRSAQITAYVEEHGCTRQHAALRTRQGKPDELDPQQVINNTRDKLKELGLAGEQDFIGRGKHLRAQFKQKTQEEILKHLHRTDSSFNRFELIDALTKENYDNPMGTAEAWLNEACEEFDVPGVPGSKLYCSRAQYELETNIVAGALKRQNEQTHHLDPALVEASITQHEKTQQKKHPTFKLSDEQREAVYHATMRTGGIASIEGFAGSGKSASAGAYCLAFKAAGYQVLGTSTSQAAARNLRDETGIECWNTADLLMRLGGDKPSLALNAKSVVLVDEAGMVDASTMSRIQDHVDRAGAKMILVGDTFQLQPVGAGQAFRLITEETGKIQQTEIRRQESVENLQRAKDFYQGKSGQAIVKDWTKNSILFEKNDKQEALEALGKDYFASKQPIDQRLVLVNTNADARMVANHLRHGLKEAGVLDASTERKVQVQDPNTWGKTIDMAMAVGERVRFTKTYKDKSRNLHIANNDLGEVVGFVDGGKKGMTLQMKMQNGEHKGETVDVPLNKFKHLTQGWTSTNHAAQGQSARDVFWLDGGGKKDRNTALVAFTRNRQTFKAYTTDAESLGEHMEEWGNKPAAAEMKLKPRPGFNPTSIQTTAQNKAEDAAKHRAKNRAEEIEREVVEKSRKELLAERQRTQQWLDGFEKQKEQALAATPEHQTWQEMKGLVAKAEQDLAAWQKKTGFVAGVRNIIGKGAALEKSLNEANALCKTAETQAEKTTKRLFPTEKPDGYSTYKPHALHHEKIKKERRIEELKGVETADRSLFRVDEVKLGEAKKERMTAQEEWLAAKPTMRDNLARLRAGLVKQDNARMRQQALENSSRNKGPEQLREEQKAQNNIPTLTPPGMKPSRGRGMGR